MIQSPILYSVLVVLLEGGLLGLVRVVVVVRVKEEYSTSFEILL